jgi:hypothetical protein
MNIRRYAAIAALGAAIYILSLGPTAHSQPPPPLTVGLATSVALSAPPEPDPIECTTTVGTGTVCTYPPLVTITIDECLVELEATGSIVTGCEDLYPLLDVCLSTNTRKWSILPCEYTPPTEPDHAIGEPLALPKTGLGTTLAVIAALLVAVGTAIVWAAKAIDGPTLPDHDLPTETTP